MLSCSHPDVRAFDDLRCCLSCGETLSHDDVEFEIDIHDTETAKYYYDPLTYELGQEIRLLVLHPGPVPDAIRCDIAHVNLLDKPSYEAVSYTWATEDGDASLSRIVLCGTKEIAVTRNCELVLRHLRQRYRKRTLWLDAICIDQSNVVERGHQVRLMAEIYSEASQVLAYLGPGRKDWHHRASLKRLMDYLEDDRDARTAKSPPKRNDMLQFLEMPYFDRVWVLQEIALAKMVTLIAGDRAIRWTAAAVQKLLALCSSHDIYPPSLLQWLPSSRPKDEDLLDVLRRSRNCSANDERDKIFALLGLVREDQSRSVCVDYSKTVLEVFINFAVTLLHQGRMDVLLHNASQWSNTGYEASWIPMWHIKSAYEPLPNQFSSALIYEFTHAWKLPQPDSPIFFHKPTSPEEKEKYQAQKYCFEITYRKLPCSGSRASMLPCLNIRAHLLDTITRVSARPVPINRERYDLPVVYSDTKKCFNCRTDQEATSSRSCFPNRRESFELAINEAGAGILPFFTEKSIGFARVWQPREHHAVGDTIWVLPGLAVPMILRRNGNHYFLVGECYLYRAALPYLCATCGATTRPWPMVTDVISIW
ncbi:heterokaryon incompatibility protein-domain-containing protein [Phaeosphaeria sp. MPI-PUGE-AT-0046c]|nr:heterokaryon incompatibility protein-domain-containing protein [Phaeosphaeria sp. MPI-PUGE-AT-0046c]